MKRLVVACLLAAIARAVEARDLEDILEEKGVIDKQERNEVKAAKEQTATPALPPLPDWVNKVTLSGDVRIRNESFFLDGTRDRVRQRLRLRIGAKVKANDETELGFRLATGNPDDPISNNVTFDDTFRYKDVSVTNAYIKLMPAGSFGWDRPYLTLMGGKFDVPFYVPTKLVFDGDLTPEGFYESVKLFEGTEFLRGLSLNLGQWVFEEQSSAPEGVIYAFQGVMNMAAGGTFVNVGVADYMVKKAGIIAREVEDDPELTISNTIVLSDGTVVGGAAFDPGDLGETPEGEPIEILGFANDFNMINVNADATIATGMPAWPVLLFADYVINTEADDDDTGYQFGAGIGNKKDPGDFNFTYAWQTLETDAVLSAFTDSDFGRDGGTNTEGHILQITYVWLKNLSFVSTAWIVEPIDDVEARSSDTEYRWQVDAIAKF